MPYSVDEFAAQIKAKFPEYANWPTDHLVSEVVAKHPEYRSWVTLDPRTEIAMRKENPPATAHGDPAAGQSDISAGDVLGAAGKGIAHLAGVPTSMAEVPAAVRDWALNVATMGGYGAAKTVGGIAADVTAPARAYASGQAPTAKQNAGAVPIIGRPALETARPAMAYAHGNAPTRDENLGAVESGTALAGMAAMAHPALAGAIEGAGSRAGASLEASGARTYADALAPRDAPMRPLAETIGSKLAGEGKVLGDPAKQLGPAVGGTADIPVQKFAKTTAADKQLEALQTKYPDAQITDAGTDFIVRRRTAERVQADALASSIPPAVTDWWRMAKAAFGPAAGGSVGGGVGFMLGGPAGAALGAEIGSGLVTAAEAPLVVKSVVQSPLWRTTSGVVKTSLGKAMQAGDFGTVTTIAARVLGGVGLEDSYGHDEALHKLVSSLPADPVARQQAMQDYAAVYVNPDGSQIPVPFHVQKSTVDALGPTRHASGRYYTEWPKTGDANENDPLLSKSLPATLLPDQFKAGRSIKYGSPISGVVNGEPGTSGLYGAQFTFGPNSGKFDPNQNDYDNTALISRKNANDTDVYAHETGHAVYFKDMSDAQRAAWQNIYDSAWQDMKRKVTAAGIKQSQPDADARISEIVAQYPKAIMSYHGDGKYAESFAELFGQYMANPSAFKSTYPGVYDYFRNLFGGKEYVGAK